MAFINLGQVIYPIGAIYQSWSSTSPSTLFGGTWTQITNRFLYCKDSAGETGGESSHTLTIGEMPTHAHKHFMSTTDEAADASYWRPGNAFGGRCPVTGANKFIGEEVGGGNLTTICPTILLVILGDEQLSYCVIGGVL